MAILHTPRTIAAIGRGMLKRRRALAAAAAAVATTGTDTPTNLPFSGIAPRRGSNNDEARHTDITNNAHVYKSNLNVFFDADYLGHMNNASYLTHAEYARWEWTAENGTLQTMYDKGMHFVVTNTAVRFRREISLRERAFEIHTNLHAIDDRHLWMHHAFRSPTTKDDKIGRIMAQVWVQAVAVQNRKVVLPSTLLETIGVSDEVIDSLLWKEDDNDNDSEVGPDSKSFLKNFKDLDVAFRKEAAADDERLLSD